MEAGEISSEEIDGVGVGGGVLGVCECPLEAPLQPQFSDASNKTPMQVTTFMKFSTFLASLDTRAQSSRIVVRRCRRLETQPKSLCNAPQPAAEVSIVPHSATVLTDMSMQSNRHIQD